MRKNRGPGALARGLAALLGFALTITLWATAGLSLGIHFATSEGLYNRVSLSGGVISEQMAAIREDVEALAEEYGFSAERVMALITRERVKALDRQANRWLSQAAREGQLGETPVFELEGLEEALAEDGALAAQADSYAVTSAARTIAGKIESRVTSSGMRFREVLVRAGMKIVERKVPMSSVTGLIRELPGILGGISLALAGCIALLTCRRWTAGLKYMGGSLMACGGLLVLCVGMVPLLGLGGLFSQMSTLAAASWRTLAGWAGGETLGIAAVMIALGIFCMKKSASGN